MSDSDILTDLHKLLREQNEEIETIVCNPLFHGDKAYASGLRDYQHLLLDIVTRYEND